MKLKIIVVFLLIGVTFQGCMVYHKTAITIEESRDNGRMKIVNNNGQFHIFSEIILSNETYYGIKKKSVNKSDTVQISKGQISGIYKWDETASKQATFWIMIIPTSLIPITMLLIFAEVISFY